MTRTRVTGFVAMVALAIGCADSAPKATGWKGAARDPGEAARVEKSFTKLEPAAARIITQTLDAMAATPRTAAGLRAAAQLAVDATDKVVEKDWDGTGMHPAVRALHDASIGVLAGLVAAAAKDAKKQGDTAKEDLIGVVRVLPLITILDGGGHPVDEGERTRLEAELELVFGALPPRGFTPATKD